MAEDMDVINRNITTTLRGLRAQQGYSQEYVANQLGISQYAYSKIERGKTRIDIFHIYKLANIFKVPLDFLFVNSEESTLRTSNFNVQ